MFEEVHPNRSTYRDYRAIGVSLIAHIGLLVFILLRRPDLIQLTPTGLAYGSGPQSYRVVYVAAVGDASPASRKLTFPSTVAARRERAPSPKNRQQHQSMPDDTKVAEQQSRAGSPLGTMIDGPITGHEVHVAYPIVFPDPTVVRAELPAGLQGDVIVEVTIDAEGYVIETRVLQAIGHGIDEKIVSALRQWRFQPATLDGTPVASKHDIHFHFPS